MENDEAEKNDAVNQLVESQKNESSKSKSKTKSGKATKKTLHLHSLLLRLRGRKLKDKKSKSKRKKLSTKTKLIPRKSSIPWPVPLPACNGLRHFRAGTDIQFLLANGEYCRGLLVMDPLENNGVYQLTHVRTVDEKGEASGGGGDPGWYNGILNFHPREIVNAYIHKEGPAPEEPSKLETIMPTFVVTQIDQLQSLVGVLKSTGTTEIGVKLFFEKSIKESQSHLQVQDLHWINFCTNNTLIPIDVKKFSLEDLKFLRKILNTHIFGNGGICKIFHDAALDLAFLIHEAGIKVENHYDTKVGHYYLECRHHYLQKRLSKTDKTVLEGLSEAVDPLHFQPRHFDELTLVNSLKHFVQPTAKELELLIKIEDVHYWVNLPNKETFKIMALTVKYLEQLKTNIEKKLLENLYFVMEEEIPMASLSPFCGTAIHGKLRKFTKKMAKPNVLLVDNTK